MKEKRTGKKSGKGKDSKGVKDEITVQSTV
jgi:hypothetical protein